METPPQSEFSVALNDAKASSFQYFAVASRVFPPKFSSPNEKG
jgi:hypothetical protein